MSKNVIMIRFRTSNDWPTLKIEARKSLRDAVTYLYDNIITIPMVGDISIDGVVHTKADVLALYDELTAYDRMVESLE